MNRSDYMTTQQQTQMARKPAPVPRSHAECCARTGVARPGKTAQDKARGVQRFGSNRRVWDGKAWVKV